MMMSRYSINAWRLSNPTMVAHEVLHASTRLLPEPRCLGVEGLLCLPSKVPWVERERQKLREGLRDGVPKVLVSCRRSGLGSKTDD